MNKSSICEYIILFSQTPRIIGKSVQMITLPDEKTEDPLLEEEILGDREEWAVWRGKRLQNFHFQNSCGIMNDCYLIHCS